MKQKFEVLFMAEAREFLASLDEKTRDKIIFNIDKAKLHNDKELFKKLTDEVWEFKHYSIKLIIDYSLFGIRKAILKR